MRLICTYMSRFGARVAFLGGSLPRADADVPGADADLPRAEADLPGADADLPRADVPDAAFLGAMLAWRTALWCADELVPIGQTSSCNCGPKEHTCQGGGPTGAGTVSRSHSCDLGRTISPNRTCAT